MGFRRPFWLRLAGGLSCVLLLAATLSPEACSQSWRLTTEAVVPVQEDNAARALLDTLLQMGRRTDTIEVRRNPEGSPGTVPDIQDQVLEQARGLALGNANLAYISYRFEYGEGGFRQTITGIQYQYVDGGFRALQKGQAGASTDVIYVDGDQRWFQRMLQQKGTVPESDNQEGEGIQIRNELVRIPFMENLSFARLAQRGDMEVSQISGQPIRGNRDEAKEKVLQELYRLVYQ